MCQLPEPLRLTKTVFNIKLGLVGLCPKISAQYLSWGPSNCFFSVGLESKWLLCVSRERVVVVVVVVVESRIVDYNASPNSCTLAKLSESWG